VRLSQLMQAKVPAKARAAIVQIEGFMACFPTVDGTLEIDCAPTLAIRPHLVKGDFGRPR
jgi:hypothetical protein